MPVDHPPIREAARAFSVVLGPSVVLDAVAGAALATAVHSLRRHRRPSRPIALASGLVGAYLAVGRPLMLHWGATCEELHKPLPGDDLVPAPATQSTRAVTIDAPPAAVWPWLAQLGQDRAGFYSYDWLERLFLADVHNVNEIRPEWQHRAVGDFVRATPPNYLGSLFGRDVGWTITHVEPGRALVLDHWGAFVLEPAGSNQTRFIIRSSIGGPDAPAWGAGLTFALFELPHFIMERKMMLTIKARAEGQAAGARLEG